jgi:replicative superfamily II helicase
MTIKIAPQFYRKFNLFLVVIKLDEIHICGDKNKKKLMEIKIIRKLLLNESLRGFVMSFITVFGLGVEIDLENFYLN